VPARPATALVLLVVLGAAAVLFRTGFTAAAPTEPAATEPLPSATPPLDSAGRVERGPRVVRRARLHRLAVLRGSVPLRLRPGGRAAARLGSRTEFGSRRVLGVAARRGPWLGVVATERPNGRLGWVHRRNPRLALRRTRYSLHADLSRRRLVLRRGGRRVHSLSVAIGRPGSPTPTGRFAVTDKLRGSRFSPYYGCCILALSGHQPNTPPGWQGGNRLAIHGTDAPATIGTPASAGCLRGADAGLVPLMRRVPLGTAVFIRR
jgi:L,D-transpeptidase catalytic domain